MSLDQRLDQSEGRTGRQGPLVDVEQLEPFVRSNTAWMLAVAVRILQDKGHAEDAVQVAFTKILTNIDGFEGRSAL